MSNEPRYKVPPGFRALLEALAREVLRSQPSDIYAFSTLFFDTLSTFREQNDGHIPFQKPGLYDEFKRILHEEAVKKELLAATPDEKRRNSEDEERGGPWRHFASEPAPPDGDLDKAATKIQAAFRSYEVRHHPEKFGLKELPLRKHRSHENLGTPLEADGKKKSGSVEHLASPDDAAATKIQAEIRGFLTRKHFNEMKKDMDSAATKIQASFRGFTSRKQMEEQGLSPRHTPEPFKTPPSNEATTPEDEMAAAKIQAGFKGFMVRQELKKEKEAATKIQAAFRGHNTRVHMQEGEQQES